ncbi:MAG: LLM class F420-dependent oxidoreductase [Actinobacteria bacterium]|nr:LLM class F420-dependent oxidoreductase [Actinomycetota bacterium]
MNPRLHNEWELTATPGDVVAIASVADELGFQHLTASEHVAVPRSAVTKRGARYYDPLATLSFLAGRTEHIRLATHVLVLGYHHPLAIVKRYSTLDVMSRGRVILGVGVGSLQEEFALLDAPFDGRGARADDAIRAIRAAWGEAVPSYSGAHYSFDALVIDPRAPRPDVAIWVGGRTARSLRRAVELGDGWVPFGLGLDEVRGLLDAARETAAWTGRRRGLDVVLHPDELLDPIGDPDHVREVAAAHRGVGATALNVRLRHGSRPECIEQLHALAEL